MCVSSTFYTLASDDSSLRGTVLLESSRTKALVADVSRFLRACGEEYKNSSKEMNAASKTKIDKLRTCYIRRISSIVPHHYGDYSNCRADDCAMLQIQRVVIAKNRSEEKLCSNKSSTKEVIRHCKTEINTRHANQSRFKGKIASIGEDGQALVLKEVTKRLSECVIDLVAIIVSSNGYENLLSMLAKFSHGKRHDMD